MSKTIFKTFSLLSIAVVVSTAAYFANAQESDSHDHDHAHEKQKMPEDSMERKRKIAERVADYEKYVDGVKEFEKSEDFKGSLLGQNLPFDINIGSKDAPVTIVEYASLSCIHCKMFHEEVFYNLKKDYIDTGKVQMKYRHYPLNGNAVKAALIVDCVNDDVKLAFLGALFKGQSQWGYAKSESALIDRLKTISKIGGLTGDEFEACYNNEENQDKLLSQMKDATESLKVDSTPAIFVNGSRYLKTRSYEAISKHIDDLLKDAGAKAPSSKDGDKTEEEKELDAAVEKMVKEVQKTK